MRAAVLGLAVEHPVVRPLINPRQTQPVSYKDSPLTIPCEGGARFGGPMPGDLVPECPISLLEGDRVREGHLTELLSPCFTALCFTDDGRITADLANLEGELRTARIPFRVVTLAGGQLRRSGSPIGGDHTGRLFPMYAAEPGTVYLVRPDGYVLARWREATAERIQAAIDQTLRAETRAAGG